MFPNDLKIADHFKDMVRYRRFANTSSPRMPNAEESAGETGARVIVPVHASFGESRWSLADWTLNGHHGNHRCVILGFGAERCRSLLSGGHEFCLIRSRIPREVWDPDLAFV